MLFACQERKLEMNLAGIMNDTATESELLLGI